MPYENVELGCSTEKRVAGWHQHIVARLIVVTILACAPALTRSRTHSRTLVILEL